MTQSRWRAENGADEARVEQRLTVSVSKFCFQILHSVQDADTDTGPEAMAEIVAIWLRDRCDLVATSLQPSLRSRCIACKSPERRVFAARSLLTTADLVNNITAQVVL